MFNHTLTLAELKFSKYVVAHLKAFAREIDVTQYVNQYHWDGQRVMDLYLDVLWNNPEIFFVSKVCRYGESRLSSSEVRFAKICDIRYDIEPAQYPICKARLDSAVRLALQTVRGIQAPECMALKLHDFIVENCEYDLETLVAGEDASSAA